VESLKGIQASLFEVIAPELRSPFAQHTLQTMFMLLESVAAELATEAETRADGERIDALLSQVKQAVDASTTNDPQLLAITAQLPADDTQAKAALLERAIVALESSAGRQPPELEAARNEIYAYLREVAGRGWSFWDMLSFRKAPS
jgi:hypothetical protein